MYVPIGIDCGLADLLKQNNVRHCSLPFDWVVSYGGVSKIIENEFQHFTDIDNKNLNLTYNISFVHNTFPQDCETINRRIQRFLHLLNSEEEITFIRKGHAFHHHDECIRNGLQLANDIEDAEKLNIILKTKYPKLKYKIIVVLVCDTCFKEVYHSDNITICNIATPYADNAKFELLLKSIIT